MKTLVWVGPNCTRDVTEIAKNFNRVVLFEPLPEVCQRLKQMLPGATVVEAACSDAKGTATLRTYNRQGLSSSLYEVTDQARQKFGFVDWDKTETVEVDTVNLGDWLDENGIGEIKMMIVDAQGMDLRILKTVEQRLKDKTIGMLQTECDDQGFQHYQDSDNSLKSQREFMEPLGYRPSRLTSTVTFHPDVLWCHD
jgi:FkbM family methyltransferase